MRVPGTTEPQNQTKTTSTLVQRLQREASLSLPQETPSTTILRTTEVTTEGAKIERIEPTPAPPADDETNRRNDAPRSRRSGDRPQNKIGNQPAPEQPPAEVPPPETSQPAQTTEEGKAENP